MPEISRFINRYDIGLFLLPGTNFNYHMALPNKFYEFVQGRLAVAIGPSPEMRRLAELHGFGMVSPDYEPLTLAGLLNRLGADDIMALKRRAHAGASELCAERNRDRLVALVSDRPRPPPPAEIRGVRPSRGLPAQRRRRPAGTTGGRPGTATAPGPGRSRP